MPESIAAATEATIGNFAVATLLGLLDYRSIAVYNGTYLIPEFVITVVVIYILLQRKLLNVYM